MVKEIERILEHFEFNLSRIVDIARAAEIDIILVTRGEECATCNLIDGATSASVSRRHGTRLR